jgi:cell shape-determining protein MreC
MGTKLLTKLGCWIKIVVEIVAIISTVLFLLYYPIDAKFATVQTKIETIESKVDKSANLELVNIKLEQILSDIQRLSEAIEKCQAEDEKFRERLYQVWAQ